MNGTEQQPSRRPLILASAVAVVAVALLAAGCGGGGGSPGVASVATTTTATTAAQNGTTTQNGTTAQNPLVAFANCMRSSGVPSFPDPQRVGGAGLKLTIVQGDASPQFQAAMRTCHHLLPSGGAGSAESAQQTRTRVADGLSFARCMRGHGVSRFPDPTAQGQLTVEMVQAQGIDIHSPVVLQAVQACLPASHGMLTPARVREALNNAGG
jgi:hypothetical protein